MTESNSLNRVTCKRRHPNQPFHELLESLYKEAIQNRSGIVQSLKEAISSLEKYPLPLSSGAECAILKGFDQRLCRYIDSKLNEPSKNKKTKISDNRISNNAKVLKVSLLKEISDSTMTSKAKKNRKNTKNLEANVRKCPFKSKFDQSSYDSIVDSDLMHVHGNQKAAELKVSAGNDQTERNKNNNEKETTTGCHQRETLGAEVLNGDKKDSNELYSNEESHNNFNDISFLPYDDWDSFTDQEQKSAIVSRPKILSISQPIEVADSSGADSSGDENHFPIKSSGKVAIYQQSNNCLEENKQCEQCDSISNAAGAFQLYFEEKTKHTAEEISKCVLPRKMYKPAYRSAAYAILIALHEQQNECPYRDCLNKDELIQKAQKHTDQSFTCPKPDSNYTAWTNTRRLINKGMIQIASYENKSDDFYMLTTLGKAVAMELVRQNAPKVTVNDVIFHGQRNDRVPSLADVVLVPPPPIASINEEQNSVFIEMPPGTFDIIMLIDKRENFDKTILASPNNYCKYEARSLTIGDFLWIARSKKTGQELVLPYIVERKRLDDLASSIKDGRFHEQKFRLRKCGLKNVLYLVESYKKHGQYSLPMATLTQAVVNTSILEEFNIVKTDSLDHTFKFLGLLSESLVHEFLPLFLRGCNKDTQGRELMIFEFFNKFSCKNKSLTVRDTFIKMLLQLKGLSVEKALAITRKYSTPRLLMKAYEECTVKEGELLLAGLKFKQFSRNVGPVVSKAVYKLFSKEI